MRKILMAVMFVGMSFCAEAVPAGVVIKGVMKSWDEIAQVALKVSGKAVTDDAVRAAAKTIEKASFKYGDDVARAATRGGVEVAEESLKRGGKFVVFVKRASEYSDEAVRAVTLHADDAMKYTAKYGDDVVRLGAKAPGVFTRGIGLLERSGADVGRVLPKIVELPAEQIPRVFGAIERNPHVAKEFLEGVGKGGVRFVDKIFSMSARQILAGTLGSAAILAAWRATEPFVAAADGIRENPGYALTIGIIGISFCGLALILWVYFKWGRRVKRYEK